MPRIARGLVDNCIYQVIIRGNGRCEMYHKERDYEAFLDLVKKARVPVIQNSHTVISNEVTNLFYGYQSKLCTIVKTAISRESRERT